MPVEIGGSNGVKPVAYAGLLDLPIIDGDAMGRAFPEVQMVSMNVAGLPPGIVLLCDPHGNIASFEPVDELWAERLARTAAVAMGGSAVEIDYIMSVAEARRRDRRGLDHHGDRDRPRATGARRPTASPRWSSTSAPSP